MAKRLISTVLLTTLLGSCATTPTVTQKITPPRPKKIKPVEVIPAKVFVKRDYLVQRPANRVLIVNFQGGTLQDLADYLSQYGIVVRLDPSIKARKVGKIVGEYTLKEILQTASYQAGVYWQAEGNFAEFDRDKIVTYQFPLFSSNLLQSLYNFGDDSDKEILTAFRDSFFKTLEDSLKDVLTYPVSGTYDTTQEVSYQKVNKANSQENAVSKKEKEKTHSVNDKNAVSRTKDSQSTVNGESKSKEKTTNQVSVSKKSGTPLEAKNENSREKNKDSFTQSTKEAKNSENRNRELTLKKRQLKNFEKTNQRAELTKEEEKITDTLNVKEDFTQKGKVLVNKELGTITVRVTPLEEEKADELVRELSQEVLGKMVSIKVYVVELQESNGKNFEFNLNLLRRIREKEFTGSVSNTQVQLEWNTLATGFTQGIAKGVDVSTLINYLTTYSKAKIISSSTLLALPRIPARISSVVEIPFAVPTQISQGGTNPTLTYDIKTVEDGLSVRIVPSVLDDGSIVLGLGIMENQYLGDKVVQAGNVGTVTLPIQSPRKINTIVRVIPGDVVFIGGIKRYKVNSKIERNAGIPVERNDGKNYSELYVILQPRLILFGRNSSPCVIKANCKLRKTNG